MSQLNVSEQESEDQEKQIEENKEFSLIDHNAGEMFHENLMQIKINSNVS